METGEFCFIVHLLSEIFVKFEKLYCGCYDMPIRALHKPGLGIGHRAGP